MASRGATLRLLASFAVSAVLLALLLRAAEPERLGAALASAELWPVLPSLVAYFGGLWLRSLRWRLLLPPGSAPAPTLFRALAVGLTVNNLLPVRLGELARAYLLSRWCGVKYGWTLASVLVERVLDGLTLGGLLLVGLLLVPSPPGYLLGVGVAIAGGFAVGAALLAAAAWHAHLIERVAEFATRPLPPPMRARGLRLAGSFAHALGLIRGWRLLLALVALSIGAWLLELALFYLLLRAFRLPLSVSVALVSGAVANFATLIPSAPGYVGTFDGALVRVLSDLTRVGADVATAYALLVHGVLFIPVTLLGVLILWRANVGLGQLSHLPPPRAEEVGEGDGGGAMAVAER